MITAVNVNELELLDVSSDAEIPMTVRPQFPIHAEAGAESSAVVYFEVAPGGYLGRHTDSVEEILYIVEGEGEAVIGDQRVAVSAGTLAVVPALAPHELRASATAPLKVVGFFAGAEVEHVFDDVVQPFGSRVLQTPAPAL